jgi:hypothetical protein
MAECARRRRNVELALANQRLAGHEARSDFVALLERYILGEISLDDIAFTTATNLGQKDQP